MTRTSTDEIRRGRVWNGYDYALQVWVRNGLIQDCGHPRAWTDCCNARRLREHRIDLEPGAERRESYHADAATCPELDIT